MDGERQWQGILLRKGKATGADTALAMAMLDTMQGDARLALIKAGTKFQCFLSIAARGPFQTRAFQR